MFTGVIVMVVCLLSTAVMAADFSADMINTARGKVFKGKIFIGKDKTRMETAEGITITRMDKKVVWILMPRDKMYMEQAFDPKKAPATSEKVDNEVERKLLGKETIDGKPAEKYKVVYTQNGKKETIYQWIAAGLQMPLKIAAADNSWAMEYKNIQTAKQPDSLFEIPAGYQKFVMPTPKASMKDILKGLGQ